MKMLIYFVDGGNEMWQAICGFGKCFIRASGNEIANVRISQCGDLSFYSTLHGVRVVTVGWFGFSGARVSIGLDSMAILHTSNVIIGV